MSRIKIGDYSREQHELIMRLLVYLEIISEVNLEKKDYLAFLQVMCKSCIDEVTEYNLHFGEWLARKRKVT